MSYQREYFFEVLRRSPTSILKRYLELDQPSFDEVMSRCVGFRYGVRELEGKLDQYLIERSMSSSNTPQS